MSTQETKSEIVPEKTPILTTKPTDKKSDEKKTNFNIYIIVIAIILFLFMAGFILKHATKVSSTTQTPIQL